MVTNAGNIKYMEEASKILNVSSQDLEKFIKFIRQLEEEKLHMILNSTQTTITGNIRTFLYNVHYHDMITLYGEGGLRSLNKEEIANLIRYINNVAGKINSIQQKNSKTGVEEKSVQNEPETIIESYITERKANNVPVGLETDKKELPQMKKNVQDWIERGQKVVNEDKKIAWEEYVKKSVQDQFINLDIEFILEIMERVASGASKEEVSELISQRNYSDLFSRILRKIIKEFLGKDIEIPKEKKIDVQEKEELNIPEVVKSAMSVRDTIPKEQRREINALINEIMSLEEDRRQAKENVNEKKKDLEFVVGKHTIVINKYRAEKYGGKAICEMEIETAKNSAYNTMSMAKKEIRRVKKEKNKKIWSILIRQRNTELGEKEEEQTGERGKLRRIRQVREECKKRIEGIELNRDDKIKAFEGEILKFNSRIENFRAQIASLQEKIKNAKEDVEVAMSKLNGIEKNISEKSQALENYLKHYRDKLSSQVIDNHGIDR